MERRKKKIYAARLPAYPTRLDYHPDYQENEPALLNKTGLKTALELSLKIQYIYFTY